MAPGMVAAEMADGMSLAAGVVAAAATQEAGELFRFDIEKPVTLARRGSAEGAVSGGPGQYVHCLAASA